MTNIVGTPQDWDAEVVTVERDRLRELAAPVVEQLAWADTIINGEHDICEMCEALVPLRDFLALTPQEDSDE